MATNPFDNPFDDDNIGASSVKNPGVSNTNNPFDSDDEGDDGVVMYGNKNVASGSNDDLGGGGGGGQRNSNNPFDAPTSVGRTAPSTTFQAANPFDDYHDENVDNLNSMDIAKNKAKDESYFSEGIRGSLDAYTGGDDNAMSNVHSATPAEATWQYLGDLPYRRVPIYSNVRWERKSWTKGTTSSTTTTLSNENTTTQQQQQQQQQAEPQHGLVSFQAAALAQPPPTTTIVGSSSGNTMSTGFLDPREYRTLLQTSTITKVAGCPYGGPIAVMTIPVLGDTLLVSRYIHTELRILTNAGKVLVQMNFPPSPYERVYSSKDVMEMGFTNRSHLVIVLRDSFCFIYNLRGELLLQPFHILPRGGIQGHTNIGSASTQGEALVAATVYEGGAAVLGVNNESALMEILDEYPDGGDSGNGNNIGSPESSTSSSSEYLRTAHAGARKIATAPQPPTGTNAGSSVGYQPGDPASSTASMSSLAPPLPYFALVTPLPTATHASRYGCSYLSLAVLPRTLTSSRHPEVFVSTNDNSVLVVNAQTTEITDVDCRARVVSPIVNMCFAPNGRFLACFTESAMLTVISTSFQTKVLDFDTSEGSSSPPLAMEWCGEDSVVLHWKNLGVLMVGPYGDWLRFPYEGIENLYLIPEMDCCRVITDSSVEILQRVPPATALMLRIGSIETSAMLLDASDAFETGSPASDEAARAIAKSGSLQEAIVTCTDAATKEYDIITQKRLLRAASYGMHYNQKSAYDEDRLLMGGPVTGSEDGGTVLPTYTTVQFVEAARKLRILNALRNPNVGFLLTSAQFDAITPTGVVARLIAMKRPSLALSISRYLSLPKSVQLFARASKAAALVETADPNQSDSEIAEAAIRIINSADEDDVHSKSKSASASINRGGYATVALAASKAGKKGVANLLLMLETSVADKVPALISNGSYADAMAVASSSRDADFIFATLMEYEKSCLAAVGGDVSKAQSTYLGTVVSSFTSDGFNALRLYLQTTSDVKSVTNLLLRAQKFTDAGSAMALRAIEDKEDAQASAGSGVGRERLTWLTEASRIFGLGKETVLHKQCTDDYVELLKDQEVLRTKYGSTEAAPESSSVTGTITAMIKYASKNVREQHRLLADADKVAKKFRVPEKRLWHIKVRAFAESEQWSSLRILADSRAKPPIGYKPFARAVIRGKQGVAEVLRYVDRISVAEERYDLLCEAALWRKALEEAVRMKDPRRILNVKTVCGSHEIHALADEMLGRLA